MAWLPLICAFSSVLGAPPSGGSAMVSRVGAMSGPDDPQSVETQEILTLEDVIVTGRRGSARVPPEIELGAGEIDNLGAYDIGEAIARLSGSLGFDMPPVLIVNGRQVVNPGDFTGFPPDALVRVEVLPERAAAIYGEDPARRVLNLVLQPEFKSRDGFLKTSRPTAGGTSSLSADVRQSEILDNNTRQFGVQISRDTSLRSEERSGHFRDQPGSEGVTLRPATNGVTVNASMTGTFGDWSSSLSATARAQDDHFTALVGGEVVGTERSSRSLNLSGGVSGDSLGWSVRLGLQGQVSRASQDGIAESRSRSFSTAAELTMDRTLIDLPAGPVLTTLSGRYARSQNVNDVETGRMRLSTQALDLRGNLAIPVSRSSQVGGGLKWGDVSATLGATLTGLNDDAGQGGGLNVGLAWSPVRKVSFNSLWSTSTDSPAGPLRLDPVYYGLPKVVFDFRTGEAVEVLPLLGGNPDLKAQTTRSFSLSASAGPFTPWRLQGRVGLQTRHSTDGFGAVPDPTPAVEAAFPERFIRDADGRLVSIDQRLINLGSTRAETFSSGMNINIPVGEGGGSWQLGLNHTWQLSSVASLREGLPEIDRLAGDAGGMPRHQVSLQVNGRYGKVGVNAAARWRGASRIRRDLGEDGPDDIRRAPFTALDLKLSYLLERSVPSGEGGAGARRDSGVRLELEIDNLLDARPEATLGDGRPAPGYGRNDQDPLGRVVRFTLSRRF
jgi:hypothetical protein